MKQTAPARSPSSLLPADNGVVRLRRSAAQGQRIAGGIAVIDVDSPIAGAVTEMDGAAAASCRDCGSKYCLRPVPQSEFTAIDLFAGAGGMSLGLAAAGFHVAAAFDLDPSCGATHVANLRGGRFVRADLSRTTAASVLKAAGLRPGELDLLAAGPPCQGLSILGQRDDLDPRNDLFLATIRLIPRLRPKYVLIENVPGLFTIGGGRFRDLIRTEIGRTGYRFVAAELLSAQYGVPQMRWRMVFLGARADLPLPTFPTPTHGHFGIGHYVPNRPIASEHLSAFLTMADAASDLPAVSSGSQQFRYDGSPRGLYQAAMRCQMGDELYNHYATRMQAANLARIAVLRPGQDWRDLPPELLPPGMRRALRKDHTRRFRRMRWDSVPRAIVTRFRDPKTGEYIHPDQARTISIREAARIQSFPDWFRFEGSISSQYEQVGNAVPPLMTREIGRAVLDALHGHGDGAVPKTRYSMTFES